MTVMTKNRKKHLENLKTKYKNRQTRRVGLPNKRNIPQKCGETSALVPASSAMSVGEKLMKNDHQSNLVEKLFNIGRYIYQS